MRIYVLLLVLILTSCSKCQREIDYEQILDVAEIRYKRGESLSEDVLLCEALNYYQTLEPRDSARLSQATILTAYHYWWNEEREKAYNLLEPLSGTNKDALYALFDLAYKDNDYKATYAYLCKIMEDKTERTFRNYHAMAVLYFFLGNLEECERLYDELPKHIKTPADSVLYFEKTLPNHADALSEYGKQERAIKLQTQVLNHFMGKDNWWVAKAYLSLARYHILLKDFDKAERYLLLAEKNADEYFYCNLAIFTYMQQLKSILDYAKNNRISVMEWAHFGNTLQGNAVKKRDIIEAKRMANRRLEKENMQIIIQRQKDLMLYLTLFFIMLLVIIGLLLWLHVRKSKIVEKEEEIDTLRKLLSESSYVVDDNKDDRFFKRILLQQLGVIKLATSNPTASNIALLKRMREITNQEVDVDSLLNWEDLYQTIDYIYDGFHISLVQRYGAVLNEKEIQLCCLLKANFSTKEISVVTQQSVRTVYQRKSTIRQTLKMTEAEDITTFLSKK